MWNFVDCATPITEETAKKLVAEGVHGVCRYLAPKGYSKRITKPEVEVIHKYGLGLALVWETNAGFMQGGAAQARIDAPLVLENLKEIGAPEDGSVCVYYATDFDTTTKDYDVLERYLRQAKALHPQFLVGDYGEYDLVETMLDRKAVDRAWQTYAWSGGKVSKRINLYQYKNGQTVAGIQVDLDYCYNPIGIWWPKQQAPAQPETYPVFDSSATVIAIDEDGGRHAGQAYIAKGVSYIPTRFVLEALGDLVSWDSVTNTITVRRRKGG